MNPYIPTTEEAAIHLQNPPTNSSWSVLDLLILLAQKRRFILWFTFGIALVTAVTSMLLPKRYTASTSVLPPQQSSGSAGLLAQLAGGGGAAGIGGLAALAGAGLGVKSPIDAYVAMFRSRTVEDELIRKFDLTTAYQVKRMSDARKLFEQRSTVVAGLKDGIIRISVDGPTPDQAAAMANAYVKEFQKLASGIAITEAGQRRLLFENQLEDAKNNLSKAEQDLKRSELASGMIQPDSQARAMIESAAIIQGQIAAKEVQLRAISSFGTDNNPDVVILKQQLAQLRTQLTQLTGNTGSETDLFVPKGKIPEAALDYVRKLREVKYRETIFEALASQYQLAKLDEAKQGAVFQVIDSAVPPDKRSFPQRTVLVIVFTLLSFVFACFSVWVGAAFESLRTDSEDGPKLSTLQATLRR